jgi:hypothetical protein
MRTLLTAFLAFALVPANAQTSKALVSGIVTDATSTTIASTKITVTDVRRNQ